MGRALLLANIFNYPRLFGWCWKTPNTAYFISNARSIFGLFAFFYISELIVNDTTNIIWVSNNGA